MSTETAFVFDPWAAEHRADPHAAWAQLRAAAPHFREVGPVTGRPFWFLTRYADCDAALRHHAVGKELLRHIPEQAAVGNDLEGAAGDLDRRMLLSVDPPDHTRLRRLVSREFTWKMVDELTPRIEQITTELLDSVAARGAVDLMEALAVPLPTTVIAQLLGVPHDARSDFRRWSATMLDATDHTEVEQAGAEFAGFLTDLIERRRSAPGDDLLSRLVHVEEEGDRLDHAELLSMAFLLLIAGHETTVRLVGNGAVELFRHPEQRHRLADDPSLMPTAVEEMLRYHGPVETATLRWTFEDVVLGDMLIPRGEGVIAVLMAANRDPAAFPDPDRFDVGRTPNRHLAFGAGIHHCLGAPLARREGEVAFRQLLERFPGLRPAVPLDQVRWTPGIFLRGPVELPVAV